MDIVPPFHIKVNKLFDFCYFLYHFIQCFNFLYLKLLFYNCKWIRATDANGTKIRVMGDASNEDAYISLIDIAKYKNPDNAFIAMANWMRNYSTISLLGL